MSQDMHEVIIKAAKSAHKKHWYMSGNAGTGTKLATLVTKTWQKSLKSHSPRIRTEYQVAEHLGELIDVVDIKSCIAYELKVSPNNPHLEFYRDIFKVVLARNNGRPNLKRLVFLTPKEGADKLLRGLGKAVAEYGPTFDLKIEVVPL